MNQDELKFLFFYFEKSASNKIDKKAIKSFTAILITYKCFK